MTRLLLIALLSLCSALSAAEWRYTADGIQLPDPEATPGVVADKDKAVVCSAGYPERQRKLVRKSTLLAVAKLYGVAWNPRKYEWDHDIALGLGGAPDDTRNISPQTREKYLPKDVMGAESKDALEHRLRKMVCETGEVTLEEAQRAISSDWVRAYNKYMQ